VLERAGNGSYIRGGNALRHSGLSERIHWDDVDESDPNRGRPPGGGCGEFVHCVLANAASRSTESSPSNRRNRLFAVGTPITGRPPHRSVRARFGHTAPT